MRQNMNLSRNGVLEERGMDNSIGYTILILIPPKPVFMQWIEMVIAYRYLTKMEHFFSNGDQRVQVMDNLQIQNILQWIQMEMFTLVIGSITIYKFLNQ